MGPSPPCIFSTHDSWFLLGHFLQKSHIMRVAFAESDLRMLITHGSSFVGLESHGFSSVRMMASNESSFVRGIWMISFTWVFIQHSYGSSFGIHMGLRSYVTNDGIPWVFICKWLTHDFIPWVFTTHFLSCPRFMIEQCHMCDWFMSQIWLSHVTHICTSHIIPPRLHDSCICGTGFCKCVI